MSFKREGNDAGMLDNLRKRRIKELFAEDIPQDEAKLLCNGRFACLVCKHNPVFDTVNMLMVHRKGKKHTASEEEFLRKKKELQTLILKRKHEQYMKDGTTKIRQEATTLSGGVSWARPYNPCVKKQKVKQYERRPRLDLIQSEPASYSSQFQSPSSSPLSDAHAFLAAAPDRHSAQLKNIFRPPQRSQGPVKPYVRQHASFTNSSTSSQSAPCGQFPSAVPSGNQGLTETVVDWHHCEPLASNASASSAYSGLNERAATSRGLPSSSSTHPDFASLGVGNVAPSRSVGDIRSKQTVYVATNSHLLPGTVHRLDQPAGIDETGANGVSVSLHVQTSSNPALGVAGSSSDTGVTQKKKLALKYHQISGSGWKKDWDGKWIRDEEAEFDSDEEPPDLP